MFNHHFKAYLENLPIPKIGGYVSITNTLRTDKVNQKEPTIQPTIFHLKQATGPGHSDKNHLPIDSLNSGIDVPKYGQNIDNRTRMIPQETIATTITESNIANNYDIIYFINKKSYIACRGSPYHGTIKK